MIIYKKNLKTGDLIVAYEYGPNFIYYVSYCVVKENMLYEKCIFSDGKIKTYFSGISESNFWSDNYYYTFEHIKQ